MLVVLWFFWVKLVEILFVKLLKILNYNSFDVSKDGDRICKEYVDFI